MDAQPGKSGRWFASLWSHRPQVTEECRLPQQVPIHDGYLDIVRDILPDRV